MCLLTRTVIVVFFQAHLAVSVQTKELDLTMIKVVPTKCGIESERDLEFLQEKDCN